MLLMVVVVVVMVVVLVVLVVEPLPRSHQQRCRLWLQP